MLAKYIYKAKKAEENSVRGKVAEMFTKEESFLHNWSHHIFAEYIELEMLIDRSSLAYNSFILLSAVDEC